MKYFVILICRHRIKIVNDLQQIKSFLRCFVQSLPFKLVSYSNTKEQMIMKSEFTLITGPDSKIGKNLVRLCDESDINYRACSHSTDIVCDWEDITTFDEAITDVCSIYLIIPPALAFSNMLKKMSLFVGLCESYDVEHIILLSGGGEEHSLEIEHVVRSYSIPVTMIRPSRFAENFSEGFFLKSIVDGELIVPRDCSSEAYISAHDIAEVVNKALLTEIPANKTYELTGSESLNFQQATDLFNQHLDKQIVVKELPTEQYLILLSDSEAKEEIDLAHYLFSELLDGRNEYQTDDLKKLLDRQATTLSKFIQTTKASGIWQ